MALGSAARWSRYRGRGGEGTQSGRTEREDTANIQDHGGQTRRIGGVAQDTKKLLSYRALACLNYLPSSDSESAFTLIRFT